MGSHKNKGQTCLKCQFSTLKNEKKDKPALDPNARALVMSCVSERTEGRIFNMGFRVSELFSNCYATAVRKISQRPTERLDRRDIRGVSFQHPRNPLMSHRVPQESESRFVTTVVPMICGSSEVTRTYGWHWTTRIEALK
jgi:hypothetical protein